MSIRFADDPEVITGGLPTGRDGERPQITTPRPLGDAGDAGLSASLPAGFPAGLPAGFPAGLPAGLPAGFPAGLPAER